MTTLPIVSLTPETFIATEGETFAWNFSLSEPAPSGGISLFLPVTVNNDPAPGDVDFFVDGSSNISDFEFVVEDGVSIGFNFTIVEGATEATLVSEVVADDITEIDEIFTTVIADGENYRANPEQNQVSGVLTEFPVVSLVSEEVTAAEGETFAWNFSLNQAAPAGGLSLFLPVTVNNDPAPGDVDFFIDGSSNISDFEFVVEDGVSIGFNLTIAEGATEATLVSEVVADDLVEGEEISTTVIADGENYRANPAQNQVVTNFLDVVPESDGGGVMDTLPIVSLTPETFIATEGETFAWNFSLSEPAPSGGISLFLPVTVNNDPAPGDVDFFVDGSSNISDFEFVVEDGVSIGFNFTIVEGATEATLVSEVVADDITEIDEIFTTVIADGENYRANPEQNQVSGVLTEFPVVSLVSEEVTAAEGETFAWNFSLNQAAPAGGLSLFLPVTVNNDPAPGDVEYFVDGSSNISDFEFVVEDGVAIGFNLTITEGATEATLVSEAVADDITEIDEIATIVIADGENYRANPAQNQVTLILTDNEDDTIEGSFDPDTLNGGGGNDLIKGLRDDDLLDGGSGDDRLVGQGGDDTLLGGTGDDKLWGEAGDDLLDGGDGDDFLRGWAGDDTLVGGAGTDTFVLEALPGTDTIADFVSGEDAIGLKGGLTFADLSVTSDGTDSTIALGGEILAILEGVDVAPTAEDFVAV